MKQATMRALLFSLSLLASTAHAQYTGGIGGGGATNCAAAFAMLPVELLHFTAEAKEGRVQLRWATASELNNAGFTVERSADGVYFVAIAEVPGVGNSMQVVAYDALDRSPLSGTSYYRLLQTDLDGTASYSDVVSVTMAASELLAYPNPADEQLWISGTIAGEEVTIHDTMGRMVLSTSTADGSTPMGLGGLPAGRYTIRLVGTGCVRTLPWVTR